MRWRVVQSNAMLHTVCAVSFAMAAAHLGTERLGNAGDGRQRDELPR
jgi:hypothetical protein